jgi:WD40 repeat protein
MRERGGPPRADIIGLVLGLLATLFIERTTGLQANLGSADPWLTWVLGIVTAGIVIVFVVDVVGAVRRRVRFARRPKWTNGNPYPGLSFYGPDRGAVFFGRDREIRALVDRLVYPSSPIQRFVPVVGPSGSGKSSLVFSGLPHALSRGRRWHEISIANPGVNALGQLVTLLAAGQDDQARDRLQAELQIEARAALDAAAQHVPLPRPTNLLRALPGRGMASRAIDWLSVHGLERLVTLAKRLPVLAQLQLRRPMLLTIDQFEELVTDGVGDQQRDEFLVLLYSALVHETRLRVVVAIRSDFVGRFQEGPAADLFGQPFMVKVMDQLQLKQVIDGPAALTGTRFEDGLVQEMLDDTGKGDALPMLSYLLFDVYDTRAGDRYVSKVEYLASGTVAGVIAERANRILAELVPRLPGDPATAGKRIFDTLLLFISIGDSEPTRRLYPMNDLDPEQRQIADHFLHNRLLVTDSDISPGRTMVTLVHDALLRQWSPLRDHVDRVRPQLVLLRVLTSSARRWATAGRTTDFVWRGDRLASALWVFAEDWSLPLPPGVLAFVEASRTESDLAAARVADAAATRSLEMRQLDPQAAIGYAIAAAEQRETDKVRYALFAALATGLRHRADHPEAVSSAAFTFGSGSLVTGCADGLLRTWDRAGNLTGVLPGHAGPISAVVTTPGGLIVSASDTVIRTWTEAGVPVGEFDIGATVTCLTVTGDGAPSVDDVDRSLLIGAADGVLYRTDLAGRPRGRLTGHGGPVLAVAVDRDGRVVTGCTDKQLRIWSAADELIVIRSGPALRALAYLRDGSGFVAVDERGVARIWGPDGDPRTQLQPPGHASRISTVTVARDRRIITGSDRSAHTWAPNSTLLRELPGHDCAVTAVTAGIDGRLATGCADGTVRIWAEVERFDRDLVGHTRPVFGVAMSSDGQVATASTDGTARIWNRTGELLHIFRFPEGRVLSVAWSNDGRIALGGDGGLVQLYSRDGSLLKEIDHLGTLVNCVAFAPDGRLGTASDDGVGRVWTVDGELHYTLVGHTGEVNTIAFNLDGRTATGSVDATVRLYNSAGEFEVTLAGPQHAVWSVAFAPNGHIAAAFADGTVRVWNRKNQLRYVLTGHTGPVYSVAIAADGRIATASADRTVRVWTDTGRQLYAISEHKNQANAVAFGPDGQLASGSDDNLAILWPDPRRFEDMFAVASACRLPPLTSAQRMELGLRDSTIGDVTWSP